jgi:hypothetical protein
MYESVADTDSEVVLRGLALDGGRRSTANGSASLGSTAGVSLGSTAFVSTRSVMKPGLGIARLLALLESQRTRSSHWRSPSQYFALVGSCPHHILNQDEPIAPPSERASLSSLHAEFSMAHPDPEVG